MSHHSRSSSSSKPASGDAGLFLWRQAVRAARGTLFTSLVTAVLAALCSVGFACLLAQLIAHLYEASHLLAMVLLLGGAGALLLLRCVLAYVSETGAQQVAARSRVALRHQLYTQILEHGPILGRNESSGSLSTTLMERVEACDGYIARFLPQLAVVLVVPPLVLVLVGLHDLAAAAILFGCGLLMPVFLAIGGIAARKASLQQFRSLSRLSGLFHDRVKHLPTLRVFGAAARAADQLETAAQDFRRRTMAVLRVAFLSAGAFDLFFMLALALIAVHVFTSSMELAQKLTLFLLVIEFFTPLRALSASYHDRASAIAAVVDIKALLAPRRMANEGNRPAPSPLRQPSLELRNMTYTYPGRSKPALDDFTLRVEGTEFLALTGPSGAGKSTLINLLLGFIEPEKGMMFLAGQPLHLINPTDRTAAFAWVGQRNHLFYGTLADNIRLGRPDAAEVEVMAAAKAAQLGDFIASLPDGLNTLIGERGFGLSGGQAQRVALARAFLRDAPVLLLDEPTAGLDHATAIELMLTIRQLAEGRTVLMVSHDPVALQAAERVVKLEAAA